MQPNEIRIVYYNTTIKKYVYQPNNNIHIMADIPALHENDGIPIIQTPKGTTALRTDNDKSNSIKILTDCGLTTAEANRFIERVLADIDEY